MSTAAIIVAVGSLILNCAKAYIAQYTSGFHGQVADENHWCLRGSDNEI